MHAHITICESENRAIPAEKPELMMANSYVNLAVSAAVIVKSGQ